MSDPKCLGTFIALRELSSPLTPAPDQPVADVAFATGLALFKIIIQNKEKLIVFTAHTLYKLI